MKLFMLMKNLRRIQKGAPTEVDQLWKKIEREKAAGGYPWTHLQHNDDDEVWINPLKLPGDLSKDTIKRKDGTLPSEWFHLPPGAETPSVDELLRDSPEPELELLTTETLNVSEENVSTPGRQSQSDRKTPCGRRTPICGKHRKKQKQIIWIQSDPILNLFPHPCVNKSGLAEKTSTSENFEPTRSSNIKI